MPWGQTSTKRVTERTMGEMGNGSMVAHVNSECPLIRTHNLRPFATSRVFNYRNHESKLTSIKFQWGGSHSSARSPPSLGGWGVYGFPRLLTSSYCSRPGTSCSLAFTGHSTCVTSWGGVQCLLCCPHPPRPRVPLRFQLFTDTLNIGIGVFLNESIPYTLVHESQD